MGARVRAITARAVRGEVAFAAALRERVALLAGLPVEALERVYAGLHIGAGATALVRTMRAHGAPTPRSSRAASRGSARASARRSASIPITPTFSSSRAGA